MRALIATVLILVASACDPGAPGETAEEAAPAYDAPAEPEMPPVELPSCESSRCKADMNRTARCYRWCRSEEGAAEHAHTDVCDHSPY